MELPFHFKTIATASAGISSPWKLMSDQRATDVAVPPEFKGPGGALSPEDLYLQALVSCFVGTFKVYAENSRLQFESLNVVASLIVDKDDGGRQIVMKAVDMKIGFTNCEQPEKAQLLVAKVFKSGFILNSVKTQVSYTTSYN